MVDNPPFSILADIIKFYCARGIRFFLFAPALTLFTAVGQDVQYMPEGCDVLYENGAAVKTSFINNLGADRIYVSSALYEAVKAANDENLRAAHADLHPEGPRRDARTIREGTFRHASSRDILINQERN